MRDISFSTLTPEMVIANVNISQGTGAQFLDALASLDFTLVSKSLGRWVVVSN